jgi:hypothetical protein
MYIGLLAIICISFLATVAFVCLTAIKIQQIKSDDVGMFIDPVSERIQAVEFSDLLDGDEKKELISFIVHNNYGYKSIN